VSQASFESDLFQPSLTERDDAAGFDRPWNPNTLAVLTFFFGLPAGGGLLALNFWRLGMRKWTIPTAVFVAITWLTTHCGVVWYYLAAKPDADEKWWIRLGIRVGNIAIALVLARLQRQRYRLSQMTDAPQGKLFWPAVIASVLSVVATYALAFFAAVSIAIFRRM